MMKKNENFNKLNKTDIKSKSVISSDKIGQNLEKNNEFEETNSQDSNRLFESLETLLHSYDLYKFDKMYNFFHQNALIDFEGKLQFKLYKSLRVLAYLNIDETKKIIEEGLTELNSIVNNDISIKKLKSSMNIVKFTCKYLTGDYKEALDFFLSMKNNYIINSIPQYSIELDLNIASIRLLMGDIESCISVLNESYKTTLKSNLDYYQIIVPQILGNMYKLDGNYENSLSLLKISLEKSEEYDNKYQKGKNLLKIAEILFINQELEEKASLQKQLTEYSTKMDQTDFFSKLIKIILTEENNVALISVQELIEKYNDQIVDPENIITATEFMIQLQLKQVQEHLTDENKNSLYNGVTYLRKFAEKYHYISYFFKSLILESKIKLIELDIESSINIIQDSFKLASNLNLKAYLKLLEQEEKKIKMLAVLFKGVEYNNALSKSLKEQQIYEFNHFLNGFHSILAKYK